MEVVGCFTSAIPAEARAEFQAAASGRGRPFEGGVVPDFLFRKWSDRGPSGSRSVLADLKLLSCCASGYPDSCCQLHSQRGVDARAGRVAGEYEGRAKQADMRFCGTPEGQVGPVRQRLRAEF